MKRQSGFTLVEILVVVAILGILGATGVPVYRTWQGRAYGSEAAIMLKQIIAAEINYYLEHNKFFPDNNTYIVLHEGQPEPTDIDVIKEIADNLHITIKQGHFLEYYLQGVNVPGDENFYLTIRSREGQFQIFKGAYEATASLDKNGNTLIIYPSY